MSKTGLSKAGKSNAYRTALVISAVDSFSFTLHESNDVNSPSHEQDIEDEVELTTSVLSADEQRHLQQLLSNYLKLIRELQCENK